MSVFQSLYDGALMVFSSGGALLWVVAGTILGIIVAAIPGLTATMAIALLVPLSYGQPMLLATALLIGIYVGGMYGGSISAILLNTPGAPCSACTQLDGFPLARKGLAGRALATSTIASTCGGLFSAVVLIFAASALAKVALNFSMPEYFVVTMFGIMMVVGLAGDSVPRGFISAMLGMFVSMVGMDIMVPIQRFSFGNAVLKGGMDVVPVMIGVFACSQVFVMIDEGTEGKFISSKIEKGRQFSWADLRSILKTIFRSSVIGTIVGIIPAAGPNIAAFLGYVYAKQGSKHPEQFGKGTIDGVAGAEAANNAVSGGALVPLLTFGIPGDTVTAILLGAFILHGYIPGPLLFTEAPEVVYPLFVILILANIIMLVAGLGLMRVFPPLVTAMDKKYLICGIAVFAVLGGFVASNKVTDAILTMLFGLFGYFFTKCGYSVLPLSITVILGSSIEKYFRLSLIQSQGNPLVFFTRPICIVLWVIIIIAFIASLRMNKRLKARSEELLETESDPECFSKGEMGS